MITYRSATMMDLPVLASLDREHFPYSPWPIEQFRAELSGKTRNFIVAEMDGEIIGYAGAFLPNAGGEADIMTIAVNPEHRRKGIASHFISELENWAKSRGADFMMLEVITTNESGIALYEKVGYQKLNIRKNYYGYGNDAQVMKKLLK